MSLLFKGRQQGASRSKVPLWQRFLMFFVSHIRQALGSLGELWRSRAASAMTIAVLGLSITLPSTFYIMLKNTEQIDAGWQQASEISVFLREDVTDGDVKQLMTRLTLWPEVDTLTHIDKQEALNEFRELSEFGQALNYLDDNPLPHVLLIAPTSKHRAPTAARVLLNKLEKQNEVASGQLDIQWLERLHGLVSIAKEIIVVVAALLFLSVVLIIGNTIRLNILSRRDEILVMKLVGATDAFIQRPFLYTGFWYGLLGGLLAWLTVALLLWWISDSIESLASLYDTQFTLTGLESQSLLVMLGLSVLLGLLGSFISVKKHIQHIEPK